MSVADLYSQRGYNHQVWEKFSTNAFIYTTKREKNKKIYILIHCHPKFPSLIPHYMYYVPYMTYDITEVN